MLLREKTTSREVFGLLQDIILGAELEGRDGRLAVVARGDEHRGHVAVVRAELAEGVERELVSPGVGPMSTASARPPAPSSAVEFRLIGGGGQDEFGGVGPEKFLDGAARVGGDLEQQHLVAFVGGGRGGRRELLFPVPGQHALHEVDDLQKLRRGLVHAIHRARPQRAHREVGLAVAAGHDDRGRIVAPGEFAQDLQAVDVGQHEVEQEDVDAAALHPVEAGAAGGSALHDPVGGIVREVAPDDGGDVGIILSVKDAGHGWPAPGPRGGETAFSTTSIRGREKPWSKAGKSPSAFTEAGLRGGPDV